MSGGYKSSYTRRRFRRTYVDVMSPVKVKLKQHLSKSMHPSPYARDYISASFKKENTFFQNFLFQFDSISYYLIHSTGLLDTLHGNWLGSLHGLQAICIWFDLTWSQTFGITGFQNLVLICFFKINFLYTYPAWHSPVHEMYFSNILKFHRDIYLSKLKKNFYFCARITEHLSW